MSVPEQTPYKEYTANGSATSFALGFICDSKNDLVVLVDNVAPPVATWSLVGGNAVFTTAPASGKKIILQRQTKFERTTNFQGTNNSFRPETINKDIDRVWLKLQELGVADWLMKLYVDRLHQEQKEYIDQKDDELKNYLIEEIRKQGVALDQLEDYYNRLMQKLAEIALEGGWTDSVVATWSGRTQEDKNRETLSILDFGGIEGETCPTLLSKFATLADARAAYPDVADKITSLDLYVNDVAALHSEALNISLKLPAGTWRFSSPYNIGVGSFLYGKGAKCVFDKAETRRKGGSTGASRPAEQYTLYYRYDSDSQIKVTINGVEKPWDWWSSNVISVADVFPTTSTDLISYYIENGYVYLSDTPESFVGVTVDLGSGNNIKPSIGDNVDVPRAGNLVRLGARAGANITTGGNGVYIGARAGSSVTTTGNNIAIGFQAYQRGTGTSNSVIGSVAMEWHYSGDGNSVFGSGAASNLYTGDDNTAFGVSALKINVGSSNTVIGALSHTGVGFGRTMNSTTSVGAQAGRYHWGANNVFLGYAAGRSNTNNGMNNNNGEHNIAIGWQAQANVAQASNSVAVGSMALQNAVSAGDNVAVGFEALRYSTAGVNVAIGSGALKTSTTANRSVAVGGRALNLNVDGSENTAIGYESLINATSSENTALGMWSGRDLTTGLGNVFIGARSGYTETTGNNNVVIGRNAGNGASTVSTSTVLGADAARVLIDGTTTPSGLSNFTTLGYQSRVSASNQVQLGNSATTTYVYGTVQNRSDARDKADVRDTALGLDFICSLRPVDYKWDMREDYIQLKTYTEKEWQEYPFSDSISVEDMGLETKIDESGKRWILREVEKTITTKLPKDGSKKRNRYHHGFIAQEVKALADQLGVDFGGYQDHTLQGGSDVLSIGYDEFIAPTIKAIQQISERLDAIEQRLAAANI